MPERHDPPAASEHEQVGTLAGTLLLEQFVIAADWYRRCLEDAIDKRPVRGLDEARHGYDAALEAAQEHLREVGLWTTT